MKGQLCTSPEYKNHFMSTSIKNLQYLQQETDLILRWNNFDFKQLNNFDQRFFKAFLCVQTTLLYIAKDSDGYHPHYRRSK